VKRRLQRLLLRSTAYEIVSELVDPNISGRYKMMRFLCRCDSLRALAQKHYRKRQSRTECPVPIVTTHQSVVIEHGAEIISQTLVNRGFATGITLRHEFLFEILDFCSKTQFIPNLEPSSTTRIDLYDERNPALPSFIFRRKGVDRECEAIAKVAYDPLILKVAELYLEAVPVFHGSRIFWSYPPPEAGYQPDFGFHYDIDDYKFLKLFFYLNDVDEGRGPHVIIEGTHRRKNWFEKLHRRLTDTQAKYLYAGKLRPILGREGEGFFEDTFCYHKGEIPRKRRLVLEFEYALSSY
jgi:hypothetical protein